MRAYIYSVAICHQTHTLINRKKNLKGWDYLEHIFTRLAKENPELLDSTYLGSLSTEKLSERLKPLFADDSNPENYTLDRLEERSRFLVEIAKILNEKYDGKVTNLVEQSQGFLINEGKGLYELLDQFEAYTDPLKKKSTYFIKVLIDSDLVKIKDPENFVPVMDYHMQRVLLRMGCVEILDKELREKLLNRDPLKSDIEIREACVEAVKLISDVSDHEIIRINDFLWPLGRSCCRDKPLCIQGECSKDPCTFELVVDLDSHDNCIFEGVCKGSKDENYRNLWQPIVDTHYY